MICPRCGADLSAETEHPAGSPEPGTRVVAPPPLADAVATAVLQLKPRGDASDGTHTGFVGEASTGFVGDASTSFVGDASTRFVDSATRPRSQRPAPARTAASVPAPLASVRSATGPLVPGQVFGSRYHIIRALGVGGMGAVYQAWDAELGVPLAIKVIRPDVMDDPGVAEEVERRFKRELLLAREVTHPNVVRIHDLGEIDGIKYITMTYVEGSDLSSLLKREGTLLVPTVLRIARAVVAGLVAAHKAGVVHRDLKP